MSNNSTSTTTPPRHQQKTNSVQDKIVKYVNEIPGIRYRELLRMTGVSNGVLSYHLRFLDNTGE
jgi:predicted transcriptional regulator